MVSGPGSSISLTIVARMSTSLLKLEHLNISFRSVFAVRDLSFSIAAGEALGLVGESGSGKSVTSLAIMRLLPLQASITVVPWLSQGHPAGLVVSRVMMTPALSASGQ